MSHKIRYFVFKPFRKKFQSVDSKYIQTLDNARKSVKASSALAPLEKAIQGGPVPLMPPQSRIDQFCFTSGQPLDGLTLSNTLKIRPRHREVSAERFERPVVSDGRMLTVDPKRAP